MSEPLFLYISQSLHWNWSKCIFDKLDFGGKIVLVSLPRIFAMSNSIWTSQELLLATDVLSLKLLSYSTSPTKGHYTVCASEFSNSSCSLTLRKALTEFYTKFQNYSVRKHYAQIHKHLRGIRYIHQHNILCNVLGFSLIFNVRSFIDITL